MAGEDAKIKVRLDTKSAQGDLRSLNKVAAGAAKVGGGGFGRLGRAGGALALGAIGGAATSVARRAASGIPVGAAADSLLGMATRNLPFGGTRAVDLARDFVAGRTPAQIVASGRADAFTKLSQSGIPYLMAQQSDQAGKDRVVRNATLRFRHDARMATQTGQGQAFFAKHPDFQVVQKEDLTSLLGSGIKLMLEIREEIRNFFNRKPAGKK